MAQTKRPRTRSRRPAAAKNENTAEAPSTNGETGVAEADAAEATTAVEDVKPAPVPQASSQRAQIEAAEKAAQEQDPPKPAARPGARRKKKKKNGSPLRTAVAAALLIGVLAVAAVGVLAFLATSDSDSTDDAAVASGVEGTGDDSDASGAGDGASPTGTVGADDGGAGDGAGDGGAVASDAISVPLPEGIVRYVANTGGGGVRVRTACEQGASTDAIWAEGTKVTVDERGTATCAGWSVASSGTTQSWVKNDYLSETKATVSNGGGGGGGTGGGSATGAIVTGTTSVLPKPGVSWAQTYCIQYQSNGAPGEICRTFPSVQRSGWLAYDLQTYASLTEQRQQVLINCYLKDVKVGAPLDSCVYTSVLP